MFRSSAQSYHDTLPQNRFSLSRGTQRSIVLMALFLLLFFYISLQIFDLLLPPELTVVFPDDGATFMVNPIELSGYTDRNASVMINNNLVFPDQSGFFKKEAVLQGGINTFVFTAENSFGRKTSKTVRVLFERVDVSAQK